MELFIRACFLLLLVIILCSLIESCIFKYHKDLEPARKYYMKVQAKSTNYTRISSKTNPTCECGIDVDHYNINNKSWILYIHFKTNGGARVCPGTIINSNMVLTSHKCMMKSLKVTKMFPTVAEKVLELPTVKEIKLSTKLNYTHNDSVTFNISKIIYRNEFPAEYFIKGANAPESDVVIIVVKGFDFNNATNISLAPICVPRWNDIPRESILNKEGFYQGVRGWDDFKFKYARGVGNFSAIMTADECNNVSGRYVNSGSEETLCLRFTSPGPTVEGGPLRLMQTMRKSSGYGPVRSYLIGLASHVDHSIKNAHQKYAYFTNINTNVKYIEEKAVSEKSEWCTTPSFSESGWPWEFFEEGQNETLDCDCGGKINETNAQARILFGEDATPQEFPWIVKFKVPRLTLKPNGNDTYLDFDTPKYCAGTVINSKMILTSASCITNKTRAAAVGPNFNILNIFEHLGFADQYKLFNVSEFYTVTLNSHFKQLDYNVNEAGILADVQPVPVIVDKMIFHPTFTEEIKLDMFSFDIALIVLKEDLSDSLKLGNVTQICLPKLGDVNKTIAGNLTGIVAGWGGDEPKIQVEASPVLTKTTVWVHSIDFCESFDADLKKLQKNFPGRTDTLVCTGSGDRNSADPFKDPHPYHDDFGAPLVIRKDGQTKQLGVFTSYVHFKAGAEPNPQNVTKVYLSGPTYYANVEAFLPFINYYSRKFGAKSCRQYGQNPKVQKS